ncbi:MAG: hypothetical protein M1168_01120 [Candidatus Marsarchaeota archaeon]|nr:hypothetical protein [Candidatus Marsarchaeota archaeon]MCL5094567.1 hypothetical protein [Candidatus Marsarchaeota archaeon]
MLGSAVADAGEVVLLGVHDKEREQAVPAGVAVMKKLENIKKDKNKININNKLIFLFILNFI